MTNFQRVGAVSNSHFGREFELVAQKFFASQGVQLQREFAVQVGYVAKKTHRFDLGSGSPAIIVECKSYTWTAGGNSPSAKIRGMNEVMLLFSVAPPEYRKVLFVLKHLRKDVSLASHYIKNQGHLIGPGIEVWECDVQTHHAECLMPAAALAALPPCVQSVG